MDEFIIAQDSHSIEYYVAEANSPEEAMQMHLDGESFVIDTEWLDAIGGPEVTTRDGVDYVAPLHIISGGRNTGDVLSLSESGFVGEQPPRATFRKGSYKPPQNPTSWFDIWETKNAKYRL